MRAGVARLNQNEKLGGGHHGFQWFLQKAKLRPKKRGDRVSQSLADETPRGPHPAKDFDPGAQSVLATQTRKTTSPGAYLLKARISKQPDSIKML